MVALSNSSCRNSSSAAFRILRPVSSVFGVRFRRRWPQIEDVQELECTLQGDQIFERVHRTDAVGVLARIGSDDLIAGALNRAGLLTGSGNRSAKERVTQAAEAMQFKAKRPADEQAAAGDDLNRTVPNLSSIVFLAEEKKAKGDPTRILFTGDAGPRDEESGEAQKRRTGESVADEAAHLLALAKFISARAGDPHDADLLAAAQRSGAKCVPTYSTDGYRQSSRNCAVCSCPRPNSNR
jgi:hypothetical protein